MASRYGEASSTHWSSPCRPCPRIARNISGNGFSPLAPIASRQAAAMSRALLSRPAKRVAICCIWPSQSRAWLLKRSTVSFTPSRLP